MPKRKNWGLRKCAMRRALSAFMMACLVLGGTPMSARGAGGQAVAFTAIMEERLFVSTGTSEADLPLPATLTASLWRGEDGSLEEEAYAETEIAVPVIWRPMDGYDGSIPGEYSFIANIDGDDYTLAEGAPQPQATVVVTGYRHTQTVGSVTFVLVGESEDGALYLNQDEPVTEDRLLAGISATDADGIPFEVVIRDLGGLDLRAPQPPEGMAGEAYIVTYEAVASEEGETVAAMAEQDREFTMTRNVYIAEASPVSVTPLRREARASGTGVSLPYAEAFGKIVDPDTSDTVFPLDEDDEGRVWTDKSVNAGEAPLYNAAGRRIDSVTAEPDEFLVTFSALGQYSTIETTVVEPSDTVFVLDMSFSMTDMLDTGDSRIKVMIDALNKAIDILMEGNEKNRIAVVAFGGDSGVSRISKILPLGRYDQYFDGDEAGVTPYFVLRGKAFADVHTRIPDSALFVGASRSTRALGGTSTQRGVYTGAQILLDRQDITFEHTQPDGTVVSLARKPNIVLLSDGEPTLGWEDYAFKEAASREDNNSFSSGDASHVDMGIEIMTVLTAAYFKREVSRHYYGDPDDPDNSVKEAGFYTIGLGVADSDNARATLDPLGRKNDDNAQPLNVAKISSRPLEGQVYNMKTVLDAFVSAGTTAFPSLDKDAASKRSLVTIANTGMTSYDYADEYFPAESAEDLRGAFTTIAERIVNRGTYPTSVIQEDFEHGGVNLTNVGGAVVFSDVLGEYMEFKGMEGLWFRDKKYWGKNFVDYVQTSEGAENLIEILYTHQVFFGRAGKDEFDKIEELVTRLIKGSIEAGDGSANGGEYGIFYDPNTGEIGNRIRYYADANGAIVGPYFGDDGKVLSKPSATVCIVDQYFVEDTLKDPISGEDTDLTYSIFEVITALEDTEIHERNFTATQEEGQELKIVPYDLTDRSLREGQQMVRWYIPASLLPLRSVTDNAVINASPIRFMYSVGLKEGLDIADVDDAYKSEHCEPGNAAYSFYTNSYDSQNRSMAHFIPGAANQFYGDNAKKQTVTSAKNDNPTNTNGSVIELDDTVKPGVLVHWMGNNGRVTIPTTRVEATKIWTPEMVAYATNKIGDAYVQLYGDSVPIGAPVLMEADVPMSTPTTPVALEDDGEWLDLPIYTMEVGAAGEVSLILYTVQEGTWAGAGNAFVPYAKPGNPADFHIVYSQPQWDAATKTWTKAVIQNSPDDEHAYRWMLTIHKEVYGVDPFKVFGDASGRSIEFEIYVNYEGTDYPITVGGTADGKLLYPRDFPNGTSEIPILTYIPPSVDATPTGEIIFKVVEKADSREVANHDWQGSGEGGTVYRPDDGTRTDLLSTLEEGDFLIVTGSVLKDNGAEVMFTNTYTNRNPNPLSITLQKKFTGDSLISDPDDPDIVFLVEGWASREDADNRNPDKRIYEKAIAYADLAGGQVELLGEEAAPLVEGYYTITEMGVDGVQKEGEEFFYDAFLSATLDGASIDVEDGNRVGFVLGGTHNSPEIVMTNEYRQRPTLTILKAFEGNYPRAAIGDVTFVVSDISQGPAKPVFTRGIHYLEFERDADGDQGKYVIYDLLPERTYRVEELLDGMPTGTEPVAVTLGAAGSSDGVSIVKEGATSYAKVLLEAGDEETVSVINRYNGGDGGDDKPPSLPGEPGEPIVPHPPLPEVPYPSTDRGTSDGDLEIPRTGDGAALSFWLVTLFVCNAVAVASLVMLRRKRR